jgi:diaminohydroxyphosphoribosylaminopyrimidine deaminase / 5-amino-6-(5-phosphoribosylamino)uracil reductase
MWQLQDAVFLPRTLQLARLGSSRVFPNPQVGSLIVHEGRILAEGFHAYSGGPHAEVNALAALNPEHAALLPRCSIYVSLEPCSHYGKTPPCADLIIERGIGRVVVGCVDPNPQVAGRGLRRLREHGIEVVLAPDPTPYQALNPGFRVNQRERRPFITLKWAESPDGYVAGLDTQGQPHAVHLSGPEADITVHRLRASHQAILIGRRTAEVDNPRLTTRRYPGEHPLRVVIDPDLRLSPTLSLFSDGMPTVVLNRTHQEQRGHVLYYAPGQWESMKLLFWELYHHLGLTKILVEGGTQVLQQCLDQGAYDHVLRLRGKRQLKQGIPGPTLPPGFSFERGYGMGYTWVEEKRLFE